MKIEEITQKIVEKLQPLNPYQIILFGSYAYGKANKDSDLDLYIVTNDDFIPQSFEESFKIKRKYLEALDEITNQFAADIIIHTKKMNEKFLKLNSSFAKTIYQKGKILYAK